MQKITVTKLADALGAEISGVDLTKPMHEEIVQQIKAAWS